MSNKNETIAVVVTYNRLQLLKECIEALLNSSVKSDILIINNNSSDGTYEFLNNIENEYDKYSIKLHFLNEKNVLEIESSIKNNIYIYLTVKQILVVLVDII